MNKEKKKVQQEIEKEEASRVKLEEKERSSALAAAKKEDSDLDKEVPLFQVTDSGSKKGIGKLGSCVPVYDETLRNAWLDSGMCVPITRKAAKAHAAKEASLYENKDGMNAPRHVKQGLG